MCVRLSRVYMYLYDDRHREYTGEYYIYIYVRIYIIMFIFTFCGRSLHDIDLSRKLKPA